MCLQEHFQEERLKLGMQMIHWVISSKIIRKEEGTERGIIVSPENEVSYSWKMKNNASK